MKTAQAVTSKHGGRTRKDPRREATRVAIIEMAEALFSERGIDGVSLRQIGSAIGSSNTSVVSYHFGSKAALVEAIFHHRLPDIDRRRGELLDELDSAGLSQDVYQLFRALWLPLLEQTDSQGRHSYAGFMSALIHSDWGRQRQMVNSAYPCTGRLANALKSAVKQAAGRKFADRISLSAVMVTAALRRIDQQKAFASRPRRAAAYFDDVLHMTVAAMTAPGGSN